MSLAEMAAERDGEREGGRGRKGGSICTKCSKHKLIYSLALK